MEKFIKVMFCIFFIITAILLFVFAIKSAIEGNINDFVLLLCIAFLVFAGYIFTYENFIKNMK